VSQQSHVTSTQPVAEPLQGLQVEWAQRVWHCSRKRVKQSKKTLKKITFLDSEKKRKKNRKYVTVIARAYRPKVLGKKPTLNQICCLLRNY